MGDDHPWPPDDEPLPDRSPVALSADGGLRLSRLLTALAADRRRYALYYLQETEHAELDELAEQVAAWEHETPCEDLGQQTVRTIQIDLYHTQLPKLAETGIISYDSRSAAVRYHDPPKAIEQFLTYCAAYEIPTLNR